MSKFDLILKDGYVIDPINQLEKVCDIGFKNGLIVEISEGLDKKEANQAINVKGKYVMPGIIDSHVHIVREDSKAAGYRMLIRAGVTTAIDFKGPIERVVDEIVPYGYGLNVGVLNGMYDDNGLNTDNPSDEEIRMAVDLSLKKGALGTKILGGHYPLKPEIAAKIIEYTNEADGYVAYHAGSTENGSNILGMEETIKIANGLPLHLAHVNSYCRGLINDPLEESKKAIDLLIENPNIVSESYLADINGTNGHIDKDGLPRSHVTRNCLKLFNYEISKEGLAQAIKDKVAAVYLRVGEEMELIYGQEAYDEWVKANYIVNICFSVNPTTSIVACATAKNDNKFVIDAISTDGGAIPRNFILDKGLSLVNMGGLTLREFVLKTSYLPANMFGLTNKGHLSPGADGDVIVVDPESRKANITITQGEIALIDGYLINKPGKVITTKKGVEYLESKNIPYTIADLDKSIYKNGRDKIYEKINVI